MDYIFTTEDAQRDHPKAKFVPSLLLTTFFDSRLSEYELDLIGAPLDFINAQLGQLRLLESSARFRRWVCIVIGQPSMSNDVFMQMAKRLNISTAELVRSAALTGRLSIVNKTLDIISGDDAFTLIEEDDYGAFRWAAMSGYPAIMSALTIYLFPEEVIEMVKARGYWALRAAIIGGHFSTMERLFELAPGKILNMVRSHAYGAFEWAAAGGHLHILEKLIKCAPDDVIKMIKANDYAAFRRAVAGEHTTIVNRLLLFPDILFYAEMNKDNRDKYRHYVRPFIIDRLLSLRALRFAAESAIPRIDFDLKDKEEARCCLYILRNLIRRNDPELTNDICLLIEIPAVRALLHQEITPGCPNELVRLARAVGNKAAAEILLTVPAVERLAAHHGYYNEIDGPLDLAILARGDRESSLHALSAAEEGQLAAAREQYYPIIHEKGVDPLLNDLRKELISRYRANPATIMVNGIKLILPVSWKSFSALTLTEEQRTEALKAYYRHTDHTALRYLYIPNYWMHPEASYVYINEARTKRWSTFEGHKEHIVMLWLAAKDVTFPPTDEHTLDGRLDHFIRQLALIGRAHNWDEQHIQMKDGFPVLDEYGNPVKVERDDEEGDRPSCFSGAKKYLAQAMIGHKLFKCLTEQIIKQELRDFIRAYYRTLISDENRDKLLAAWTNYCASGDFADALPLRELDLSPEQQALFLQQLTVKYGSQFTGNKKFNLLIKEYLTLGTRETTPSDCFHALKLDALINLTQLLKPIVIPVPVPETVLRVETVPTAVAARAGGFFTVSSPSGAATTEDKAIVHHEDVSATLTT